MRRVALVLVALVLGGCETTAEKSAKLEKLAKQEAKHRTPAQRSPSLTRESTKVKVLATALVSGSEGSAAVVSLRNVSATALRDVPVEITVRSASGAALYTNDTPGLASALVSAPMLPAHGELTWIDDQLAPASEPRSVSARVGEGEPTSGSAPRLSVAGAALSTQAASEAEAEGSVVNRSASAQREVLVYAVARRAGRIVAAGRAVLPQAPANASTHFQLYFIGDPRGALLQFTAVAGAA